MFSCYICKIDMFTTASITKHLRVVHGLYDSSKLNVRCSFPSCFSNFKTFNGLRKHLLSHEKDQSLSEIKINFPVNRIVNSNVLECPESYNAIVDEMDVDETNESKIICGKNDDKEYEKTHNKHESGNEVISLDMVFNIFFSQIAMLNIPHVQSQSVYDAVLEMIENIFDHLVIESQTDININKFLKITAENIKTEMVKYKSIYKRNKILNSKVLLPKQIFLGMRTDTKFDKKSNSCKEVNIPKTFQYVPILETLKWIISNNTSIINFLTTKNKYVEKKLIANGTYLEDNTLYQQKKYFVAIQLYYDDFECVNPLGSKTGAHKMGALYFTLQNLPSAFNTHLKNIHLLALFFTSDLNTDNMGKNITINNILEPIVKDLQILEMHGIIIEGLSEPLFGSLTSLSHDNLAANCLHGMVESFQANYFCRICLSHKTNIQNLFSEANCELRNSQLYNQHCRAAVNSDEKNLYGIKFYSILNDLNFFKLCDSLSVDIMHDILEGVIPYELKLFLGEVINLKLISVADLNNRLHLYDYGSVNSRNKPSPIIFDKSNISFRQKAIQAWCLFRYFPLIIDDLIVVVPELEKKFKVLSSLLKIMSIVFAPRISFDMLNDLQSLVEEHLKLFKLEFKSNIIPKQHFMLHYPTALRKMGPLIDLWCMRYEAKHGILKYMAVKYRNYKNLAKTLAVRCQQMSAISHNDGTLEMKVQYGPACSCSLEDYPLKKLFDDEDFLTGKQKIFIYKWIQFGCFYKKGMFLCLGRDPLSHLAQFSEINEIVGLANSEFQDHIFFVAKKWKTLHFNDTLHAYKLETFETESYEIIDFDLLLYKEPYNINQTYSSTDWYLVPKYTFVF